MSIAAELLMYNVNLGRKTKCIPPALDLIDIRRPQLRKVNVGVHDNLHLLEITESAIAYL
jgi:hypothetical protein